MFGLRRGRSNTGVMLLAFQVLQFGIDRIPPVTLAIVALNAMIHLVLAPATPWQNVCVSVQSVWYHKDFTRVIKAAFFHADDWHLYFNMISFLYKGRYLEQRVGSRWFLYMIGVFTAATSVLLLYLNYSLAYLTNDMHYLQQCALGFSGVVFAVKVVTTHLWPHGTEWMLGFIPVSSRLACWFELVLIQVLVPNASFTGHLAGILVGLAYVKGPLLMLMRAVASPFRLLNTGTGFANRRSYTYTSGTAGTNRYVDDPLYTGGLDEDEQIRRATEESIRDSHGPQERLYPDLNTASTVEPSAPPEASPYGWNLPDEEDHIHPDELRRRRLARFDR